MNMATSIAGRGELARQAKVARRLGSCFVATVLEAGQRQLGRAPLTSDVIENWPHDPSASALAMRFNAALHALARRRTPSALSALYQGLHDDYDGAIGAALAADDAFVAAWMLDTPQTNEVGRSGAIAAALMVARTKLGLPFELLELGSSCGLNLNLARYRFDLGGVSAGVAASPVHVAPIWWGPPPVYAPIEVVSARGVDVNPLSAGDESTRERLLSYVWADQPQRARRLEKALAMAERFPPSVERASAAAWLSDQLQAPQDEGVCRVVFHSMVLQYLSDEDRASVRQSISDAGARASKDRPLAWISFEWTPSRSEVQLWLTCWPDGQATLLATCHAYGNWIRWR